MQAISAGGYVVITLIMLAMTIQTYRFEASGDGSPVHAGQPDVVYWGR